MDYHRSPCCRVKEAARRRSIVSELRRTLEHPGAPGQQRLCRRRPMAALPAPAPAASAGAGPSSALVAHEIDCSVHPSGIVPMLQNIVATVNLDCELDLKSIALHARNAEYNPKRFAAVIMRIRDPKTTALIFKSGKMVCTGAKSEEAARVAARKYAKVVQRLGFPATFKDFKVQNIVGSTDVRFPIRLEGLSYSHGLFCSYEPELFPGLIYRMKEPKVVLLIFVSGKVVLTGAKKREEIYAAFEAIYPVLQEFRKGDVEPAPRLPPAGSSQPAVAPRVLGLPAPAQGASQLGAPQPQLGMPAQQLQDGALEPGAKRARLA
ncbi:hypothetical protein WJX81_005852 [Elliptochloris bilobata]|uniref:TATA-box binding protein n=1 Tax=Elliptochloris bilobata TaxID=381761 RepID=A0AAW1SHI2_9CHLO